MVITLIKATDLESKETKLSIGQSEEAVIPPTSQFCERKKEKTCIGQSASWINIINSCRNQKWKIGNKIDILSCSVRFAILLNCWYYELHCFMTFEACDSEYLVL